VDLGDFFSFRIGEAMMDLDGAPSGGARYRVESIMGGRTFVKFHLDVGIGDAVLDPLEQAHMRDWLGLALAAVYGDVIKQLTVGLLGEPPCRV